MLSEDHTSVPKFLNKDRSGFGGGFKILQEQRIKKLERKIRHDDVEDGEDSEDMVKNEISRDEIIQHLKLSSNQAAAIGNIGSGSQSQLSKDLMDILEKELEKLKRTEENIKVRKFISMKGDRSVLDETEEDRQKAKDQAIEEEMKADGNYVIKANQKKIQLLRHKIGQLDSIKNLPFEELEQVR
jgi:hypothetical protein